MVGKEARILAAKEEFRADEVILVAMAPAYELRVRTVSRLAEAFGLAAR